MSTVSHDWESKERKESKENAEDANRHCVLLIGTSGVGKSSLIELFCGDKVQTSSGVDSCTKHCKLFDEMQTNKSNRIWMDTQGTDDSEMKDDDEFILKQIFKTLYDQKIENIKIIWIISGDMDRKRGEYKKQAKFISSFIENKENRHNVWRSCLIVHKRGKFQPSLKTIAGAIAAAECHDFKIQLKEKQNQQKYLFGFTCLDWMDEGDKAEDDALRLILKLSTGEQEQELKTCGYLRAKKLITHLNQKLQQLPLLKLSYLSQKCIKCGIEGDHRFIIANCHTEPIQIHTKTIENYHSGHLHWTHPSGTYQNSSVSYNYRTERYHTGSWRQSAGGTTERILTGVFTLGFSEGFNDDDEFYTWSCCGSVCRGGGCSSRNVSEPYTTYTTLYRCCDESPGSSGCKQLYTCCGAQSGTMGCKRRYSCCHNDTNSIGCTKACALCRVEWGKPSGCKQTNFMSH